MLNMLLRLKLFLKHWFRSYSSIGIMLIVPISIYFALALTENTPSIVASTIYEILGVFWLILIVQWCFSIDYDSKFIQQIYTFPIKFKKYFFEKIFLSILIFSVLMITITFICQFYFKEFWWTIFFSTIPVYFFVVIIVSFGIVFSQYSLGGLILGFLFFGSIYLGNIYGEYSPFIVRFPNVYHPLTEDIQLLISNEKWIIYNRFFYILIAVILIIPILAYGKKYR